MILFLSLVLIVIIVGSVAYNKKSKIDTNLDINTILIQQQKIENIYNKKNLMTSIEKYFYNVLTKNFAEKYIVVPQVNLASIINKEKKYVSEYQNELFRNIDFGIFDKDTTAPLLLIEINDKTHNYKKRQYRDIKVQEICEQADIKLIKFYTEYSNKEDYIVKRIIDNLP